MIYGHLLTCAVIVRCAYLVWTNFDHFMCLCVLFCAYFKRVIPAYSHYIIMCVLHAVHPPDNLQVMVIVSGGYEGILSEQLCAALCDTMFTVCSTLMWAVLTGATDWVCHIGTLTLCVEVYYCNMVEWFWWDSSLISTTNWFSSVLWHCWFGHMACKNRPQNHLLCVEWDIKPTQSLTHCSYFLLFLW